MTISISVHEPSCRGCSLCADVCPTDVPHSRFEIENGSCRLPTRLHRLSELRLRLPFGCTHTRRHTFGSEFFA